MSQRECVKRRAGRLCREKHRVMELLPGSLCLQPLSDTGARLSSPGEVEKIVEDAESKVCVCGCDIGNDVCRMWL